MRKHRKPIISALSLVLAFAMAFGFFLPLQAVAEGGVTPSIGASGEIIAFAELSPEVANMTVPLGTEETALSLPGTLAATVRLPQVDTPSDGDSGEISVDVPVTWQSAEYDAAVPGDYIFTATVEDDYIVTATPPLITVTVSDAVANSANGGIIAFAELAPEVANMTVPLGTEEAALSLPGTLAATVRLPQVDTPSDGDSGEISVDVPVKWQSAGYDAAVLGDYIFTATVEGDYIVTATPPTITVTVSDAVANTFAQTFATRSSSDKFLAPIDPPVAGSIPISTRAELEAIKDNLSGNYHLTADIDLSGADWVPIGELGDLFGVYSNPFVGIFDGQGFVIRNMEITGNYRYCGLFAAARLATIKNIGMENTDINISNSTVSGGAGAICGYLYNGTISNCYNTGNVTADNNQAGGISGYVESIDNCYNTGDISGNGAGGICGSANTVMNCYNAGNINTDGNAGGICGGILTTTSSIVDCYNYGNVSGYIVGGICSNLSSGQSISNCYNSGNISAHTIESYNNAFAGGISGRSSGGIYNCYNKGNASAVSDNRLAFVGGICADSSIDSYSEISNCYSVGDLAASAFSTTYIGGISGDNYYSSLLEYCYWNIDSKHIVNGNELDNTAKKGAINSANLSVALNSTQMKVADNYVGFDFDNVWSISPDKNDGYPYLRNLLDSIDDNDPDTDPKPDPSDPITTIYPKTTILKGESAPLNTALTGESGIWESANPAVATITTGLGPVTVISVDIGSTNIICTEPNGNRHIFPVTVTLESDFVNATYYSYFTNENTTLSIPWREEYFFDNEKKAPPELAQAAMVLAAQAYQGEDAITQSLEQFGFDDVETNYISSENDFNKVSHAIGRKLISINGKTYNFVSVVLRGTHSDAEWLGNFGFPFLQNAFHSTSFITAADRVSDDLDSYIDTYSDNLLGQDTIYFIAGHSRGAAVANILGSRLSNSYAYCFATPNTTNYEIWFEENAFHSNILNYTNTNDVVCAVPPFSYKYGMTDNFNYQDTADLLTTLRWLTGKNDLTFLPKIDWSMSPIGNAKDIVWQQAEINHAWDTYMSYLLTGGGQSVNTAKSKIVEIKCPVDVEIYNSANLLVGKITDNTVSPDIISEVIPWVEGDEKYFILPLDGNYIFKMTGTDTGIMNYSVKEYDPDTWQILASEDYLSVSLYEGKRMSSDVSVSDVTLYVVDEQGNPIATIGNDGTETPISSGTPIIPPTIGDNSGGSNGSDSGESSSLDRDSGGSSITKSSTPLITWMTASNIKNPSRSIGQFGVRAAAWAKLAGQSYYHDTMEGNAVQVRLYIERPEMFKKDAMVSGWIKGVNVNSIRGIFEKWFSNKVQAIHFDQTGQWENQIKVAARLDLAGWDTKRLYIYYYDPKSNSYRRITDSAYWLDANGYLRFQTGYAGELIVSEGPLVRR